MHRLVDGCLLLVIGNVSYELGRLVHPLFQLARQGLAGLSRRRLVGRKGHDAHLFIFLKGAPQYTFHYTTGVGWQFLRLVNSDILHDTILANSEPGYKCLPQEHQEQ